MILMLNCSYKGKNGNTQYFLKLLKNEVEQENIEIWNIKQVLNGELEAFEDKLEEAEAFVIGAPLYVDGLPAQAVKLLEILLENDKERFSKKKVYVVSNLGFYEGEQICHLFDIVHNWCERMQMVYSGGLAIGAGPMISTLKGLSLKTGLNKDIGKGLETLARAISEQRQIEDYYARTKIPRIVYLKAAHMTFRKTLKENNKRLL